jgi:glycosyltransferase involved in cell wall biosynthesis
MITGLYALVRIARDWMQNRKVASLISSLEHQNNADFDIIYLHESTSFNYLAKCLNSARRRVYLFCYDTPDKFLSWEMEGLKLPWVHASIERLLHMRDIGIVRTYIKKIFVLDSTMVKKCKMFYGITPDIIHGGIDLDVFNFTKSNFLIERYKLPENSLIISNVSRFVPYRRLHDIFEAYSQTNIKDKSKIFIYINAYDQDQQYTYELLKKYKDLIFPRGKVIIDHEFPSNDRELAQIYKSSDGFIFPNEKQTWGNAVLEAMACGVCVMVSDSCGISEIVNHGDNGLIYRCGDITEISAFISRIASQGDDSMLIGLRAAEHIKRNFSWKVWTDNHIVYFEQAI